MSSGRHLRFAPEFGQLPEPKSELASARSNAWASLTISQRRQVHEPPHEDPKASDRFGYLHWY